MNRELYAIGGLVLAVLCLIPSCKKDKDSFSFKENFEVVYNLTSRGWIFQNNSIPSDAGAWRQGITTDTKSTSYGFNAYNKKSSDDEYAFAGYYSFSPVTANGTEGIKTREGKFVGGSLLVIGGESIHRGFTIANLSLPPMSSIVWTAVVHKKPALPGQFIDHLEVFTEGMIFIFVFFAVKDQRHRNQ